MIRTGVCNPSKELAALRVLAVQDSSIGDLVTDSLTEGLRLLIYNDYNDYNNYSDCNDYRDSDLDLDLYWERLSE